MLNILKMLFYKEGEDSRHLLNRGSLVVITPINDGGELQYTINVTDISRVGAAFIYEGSPNDLAKHGFINCSSEMSETVELKARSNIKHSTGPTCHRRGAKFNWMGVLGEQQLIEFIKEYRNHNKEIHANKK
ncbi:MAG: hypothetical protein NT140_05920 [Deltaproteobacteria bacterium]|nr:hypothetical protein [Deltaproteobacteria bacterium]